MQTWFNKFAEKVESKATDGTIKILKRTYPACGQNEAWSPPYDSMYKECTQSLMRSDPQILASIDDIEAYSKVLENGILRQNTKKQFKHFYVLLDNI